MDGISTAASIMAVIQITGTVVQYLGSVKGAPKERQKILNELSNVTGILFVLKDQADETEYDGSWNATLHSLNMSNGPIEQFKGELEILTTRLAPAAGLKNMGKAFLWPFQEKEVEKVLDSIERLKGLFLLARQNDHIALTKALQNDLRNIREEVNDVSKSIARMQMSDHQEKVIRWLSAPEPSSNYNSALKLRRAQTGSWFIESIEYLSWKSSTKSFLWLYGIPGSGKTVLSSTVIEDLLRYGDLLPSSPVLYYFFSFNESEKQRPENMIRSLISQLYAYRSAKCEGLESLYNTKKQPSKGELLAILHSIMASFNQIYIVLDALDECVERPALLVDIEAIIGWQDVRLHLLTTSREEADIKESLDPHCHGESKICIQSAVVNADIRSYVRRRLLDDRRFKRWQKQPKVLSTIEDDLVTKAGGMFRWAVCQLDVLCNCLSLPQLQSALRSLPRDLDGTYEHILCRIEDSHRPYALKILQWLAFSLRPLTLEELAEVIAIDPYDASRFNPERRLAEPGDILTICSSLISIIIEYDEDKNPRNVVMLAHFSVKEYLVSDRISFGRAQVYMIREVDASAMIAEDCLAYLLCLDKADCLELEDSVWRQGRLIPERKIKFPLARYAAKSWSYHARTAEDTATAQRHSLILELLCAKGAIHENWTDLCVFEPFEGIEQSRLGPFGSDAFGDLLHSPLHYASLIGLPGLVQLLVLEQGCDVNEKTDTEQGHISALHAACMGSHPLIVEFLLENGAIIDSHGDGAFGPPLYVASSGGHEEVVRLLLANGADVNAQCGLLERNSALGIASRNGHTAIAQLLLDNNADAGLPAGHHGNALYAASCGGSIDTVLPLIRKGLDVNARGGGYGNSLQAAVCSRNIELVKLLISKGADVNAQGGMFGTALQAAVAFTEEFDIALLLIREGADVNTQGGKYGTALQAAVIFKDRTDIALLLIGEGADVNAQGGMFGTALSAAAWSGHANVVTMLIEKGADVNSSGGHFGTTLHAIARKGDFDMLRLLIEKGADVNAQTGSFGNVLQAAASSGGFNSVLLLIEKGADINAQGGHYGSALQAAATHITDSVVDVLIEKGAGVSAQFRNYYTALQGAAAFVHEGELRIVLGDGAIWPEDEEVPQWVQYAMELKKLRMDRG